MSASRLAELIALSEQPSSDRRRALLREVTDLFMATDEALQVQCSHAFDGVMEALATDLEEAVRVELATRLAPVAAAPRATLRRLANDNITVAEPVLRQAGGLSEADLLDVVSTQGQAHLRLVSARPGLTENTTDAIVKRGDDQTLGVLLRNADAPLSRRSAEVAVTRAQANPELHDAVVERRSLPADLLNEMYFVVSARLRQKIADRNAELDPAALEAALAAGRNRLASRDGALPTDYLQAEAHIRALKAQGDNVAMRLPSYLRAGERTRFLVGLADLAQVEVQIVARVVEHRAFDALAILSRAAGLDRTLFLTLTVLIDEPGKGMARAQEYGELYASLTADVAQRTLRFWRMRRESDLAAA